MSSLSKILVKSLQINKNIVVYSEHDLRDELKIYLTILFFTQILVRACATWTHRSSGAGAVTMTWAATCLMPRVVVQWAGAGASRWASAPRAQGMIHVSISMV